MQKKDSLYNYGLKPAVCHGDGIWGHGGHDIAYYRNSLTSLRKKKLRAFFSLSFSFTFTADSAVQFAYTFPYTYSDLIRYLDGLNSIALHRRSLTVSLAGNDVPLLTISNRSVSARAMAIKPVVFLSGRVHPGEAHASYVLQGALEYLLSDSQEANRLRDKFIFLIVPCLNPDGVIHGNYRCSLAGVDLNRRYRDGNALTPTITAWKELMRATAAKRQVLLYLDLHGHSARKNAFIYGCDPTTVPPVPGPAQTPRNGEEDDNKRVFARLFPKVLSATSKGVFAYRDCAFTIAKSKAGTGRVVAWRDIGILGAYTVEVSFCGSGDNSEFKLLKKMDNALALAMPPDVAVAVEEAAEDTGSEMDAAEDEDGRDDDSNTRSAKSSLSSQAAVAAPPALSIPAMLSRDPQLTHLLSTYRSATMYSVPDLLAMGRSIVTGIYHYTNLTHADLEHESEEQEAIAAEARRERGQSGKTTPSNAAAGFASARKFPTSYSSGRLAVDKGVVYNTDSSDEDSGSIPSPMVPIANAMAATVAVPKPSVMSFEEGDSSRSLGTTGVFGPQALASLLQTYPQEFSVMDKSTYHVGKLRLTLTVSCALCEPSVGYFVHPQRVPNRLVLPWPTAIGDEFRCLPCLLDELGCPVRMRTLVLMHICPPHSLLYLIILELAGVRIKCELLLRRQLGISHASLPLSRLHAVLPADHTEPEATSLDGSDSNPSQDNNTHLNRLRGGFGGWCGALRKAMLARQAEVEAASKKYKDKLLKKLIKEAAAAEAERRRKAAEAAEAAKAQIPRPRPSTATSRLPVKRVPLIPRTQQYRLSQDYAKIAVTNPQPLPTSMVNITMMSSRDADRTRIGQLQQAELAQLAQTQAQQAQFQQQMQMSSPRRDSFNSASSGMLVSPLTYERPASANAASRRSSVGTIGSTMPTPRSRAAEGGNPLRAMPTIVSPPPPASPAHTLSAGTNAAASPGTTMYVRPTGHGPTPTLTRVNSSPTAPTTPTTPRLTVVAPQLTHNVMLVRPSTSSGMRGSTAGTNLISPLRTLAKPEGKMLPDLLPLLSSPSNIKRK